jgi:alpha-tubulin suppressor-like RCC1 family protein
LGTSILIFLSIGCGSGGSSNAGGAGGAPPSGGGGGAMAGDTAVAGGTVSVGGVAAAGGTMAAGGTVGVGGSVSAGDAAVASGGVNTGGTAVAGDAAVAGGTSGNGGLPVDAAVPVGGQPGDAAVPTDASTVKRVKKLSAGDSVWCAAMTDGSVRCRDNGAWETIAGINNAKDVAVGVQDSPRCALLADGTIKCWGPNAGGQLGNGSTTLAKDPVQVAGISNAKQVAAGQNFACALLDDGTVKCWGENGWGQTGNGTWYTPGLGGAVLGPDNCNNLVCAATPVAVPGISGAVEIGVGAAFACAVISDGTARCWGANIGGTLGYGSDQGPISSSVASLTINPVAVTGLNDAVAIRSEWYHACAVTKTGTVRCWGANNYGNLGLGTTTGPDTCNASTMMIGGPACAFSPHLVPGLSNAKAIGLSANSTCALLTDGTAKCWGMNRDGELGDGTATDSASPVSVTGLGTGVDLEGGYSHFLALLDDGTVVAWGDDTNGRLGQPKSAPDLCYLNLAACSKTPIPVSRVLYGESDSVIAKDAGSTSNPNVDASPVIGPTGDAGASATCAAAVQGSCTIALAGMCTEYAGLSSLASAQASCTGVSTWSSSACAATNKVGGCLSLIAGICQTSWYYSTSGVPVATYQSICASSGGSWQTP